jgi:hypothetical protein
MSSHHSNFYFQITIQNFNLGRAAMSGKNEGVLMNMNAQNNGFRARAVSKLRVVTAVAALGVVALVPLQCGAYTLGTVDGIVTQIAVSGGADTVNPGTTCIKMDIAVPSVCVGGYIAIPNNNSKLINAVLAAKASNRSMLVYYATDAASQHCPFLAFTTCSVISIVVK